MHVLGGKNNKKNFILGITPWVQVYSTSTAAVLRGVFSSFFLELFSSSATGPTGVQDRVRLSRSSHYNISKIKNADWKAVITISIISSIVQYDTRT